MDEHSRKQQVLKELELLQKPKWRWSDISAFCHCASAKANEIRKRALEAGGKIDYDPHSVQSRAVLALMGTTPEIEIRKRRIELTGQTEQTESDHTERI
jgi:hypothetical protein